MPETIHCQDASFARAHCRIELKPETDGLEASRYVATVSVIDTATNELHPLVFRDGSRLSFPGESEALALNSTLAYLEGKFGAFNEILFGCLEEPQAATVGEPMVVEV
jgi:hypothetical protein